MPDAIKEELTPYTMLRDGVVVSQGFLTRKEVDLLHRPVALSDATIAALAKGDLDNPTQ